MKQIRLNIMEHKQNGNLIETKGEPLASVFERRKRALEVGMTDSPSILISHLELRLICLGSNCLLLLLLLMMMMVI